MRAVGTDQGGGERRAYRVAAHAGLRGFGHRLAVRSPINDVAVGETLCPELFARREHAHANVGDRIGLAVDFDCHQPERVAGAEGVERTSQGLAGSLTIVFLQECRDQRAVLPTCANCRVWGCNITGAARGSVHVHHVCRDDLLLRASCGQGAERFSRGTTRVGGHPWPGIVLGEKGADQSMLGAARRLRADRISQWIFAASA